MLKLALIWGTVAALGAVVVSLPSTEVAPDECSAGRIVSEAQFAVERLLRDPVSASFSEMRHNDGVVIGKVRAQNAFGGYVVQSFVANVVCVDNAPIVKGVIVN